VALRQKMVIFGVANNKEYDSQSVCMIVALVGFLWWEGWPFSRGSICLGRLLCVVGVESSSKQILLVRLRRKRIFL
jgi:hypothetical protein